MTKDDIVDQKLKSLIDSGCLPGTSEHTYYSKEFKQKINNAMNQRYWDEFIN